MTFEVLLVLDRVVFWNPVLEALSFFKIYCYKSGLVFKKIINPHLISRLIHIWPSKKNKNKNIYKFAYFPRNFFFKSVSNSWNENILNNPILVLGKLFYYPSIVNEKVFLKIQAWTLGIIRIFCPWKIFCLLSLKKKYLTIPHLVLLRIVLKMLVYKYFEEIYI